MMRCTRGDPLISQDCFTLYFQSESRLLWWESIAIYVRSCISGVVSLELYLRSCISGAVSPESRLQSDVQLPYGCNTAQIRNLYSIVWSDGIDTWLTHQHLGVGVASIQRLGGATCLLVGKHRTSHDPSQRPSRGIRTEY